MAEDGISYWAILKPVLIVLVPVAILLNFLPGPDGNPIMPAEDWIPGTETLDQVTKVVNKVPGTGTATKTKGGHETTKVYKWQDEKGRWHFSETPPEQKRADVEQITVTTDVNTISPLEEPETDTAPTKEAPGFVQDFNLSDLPNVLENAKQVKEMMDQRAKETNSL